MNTEAIAKINEHVNTLVLAREDLLALDRNAAVRNDAVSDAVVVADVWGRVKTAADALGAYFT